MRLASFRSGERTSYGVVNEGGITDVGKRLGTDYPALIDLIRAGAPGLAAARAAGNAVDVASGTFTYVPPVPGAEIAPVSGSFCTFHADQSSLGLSAMVR